MAIDYTVPTVGQTYEVHGHIGTIVRVYPFGTMDVKIGNAIVRVTGLPWIKAYST